MLLRHVIPQLETLHAIERLRRAELLEQRRRIARDLHDSFIQVLAALGLRLDLLCAEATSGLDAGSLRKELLQMRDTITRELQRVRAYLVEMREPLTGIETLRDLVDRTTEAFRARTPIPVDITVEPGLTKIPAAVVRELAPILREALTNVEKHARASRVAVVARVERGHLTLSVQDDGVGIGGPTLTGSR